jgi:hypothetical protein
MAGRELVTRKTLTRELAVNAVTKPLALTVGAGVAVAAFVVGTPWLLAVAIVAYLALAATTLFDPEEASRVGRDTYRRAKAPEKDRRAFPEALAPEISALVHRAHVEERRIQRAIEESGLPFADVSIEVEHLMSELERNARRAQALWTYLADQRPFELQRRLQALREERDGDAEMARSRERAAAALEHQLQVGETLRAEYARFDAEVEHLIASLGVVHGELVRISVVDDAIAQDGLAGQVRDLRRRVGAVADGMSEAAKELDH